MLLTRHKSSSLRLLVIYMISTLLFLTSIELHIHTKEAAVSELHGQSVSISSFTNQLNQADSADEITVSPDGLLKIQHYGPMIIAIFILLALIVRVTATRYFRFLKERHKLIQLPFYGIPALRAPPC